MKITVHTVTKEARRLLGDNANVTKLGSGRFQRWIVTVGELRIEKYSADDLLEAMRITHSVKCATRL